MDGLRNRKGIIYIVGQRFKDSLLFCTLCKYAFHSRPLENFLHITRISSTIPDGSFVSALLSPKQGTHYPSDSYNCQKVLAFTLGQKSVAQMCSCTGTRFALWFTKAESASLLLSKTLGYLKTMFLFYTSILQSVLSGVVSLHSVNRCPL